MVLASAIAITSSRESLPVLHATVAAALRAAVAPGMVDVVVNGNPVLARALADEFQRGERELPARIGLRIWSLPCGDKAHALNRYLADIWPVSQLAFLVDGYVRPHVEACARITEALAARPEALGATGVPTKGYGARRLRAEMLARGGIHGNFCAVRGEVMSQLRAVAYRLPLGLYRTDSTLAATLNFALDPARHDWDPLRVLVHPEVSWDLDIAPWWHWRELRVQFKRRLRQGQGVLENRAVRHHLAVHKRLPQDMPATAAELVQVWLDEAPVEAQALLRTSPLAAYGLKRLKQPRDWSDAAVPPGLLYDSGTPA